MSDISLGLPAPGALAARHGAGLKPGLRAAPPADPGPRFAMPEPPPGVIAFPDPSRVAAPAAGPAPAPRPARAAGAAR